MTFADPSLELQKAIVAALKADAGVSAICNGRIYDTVPPAPVMPYVSFGPFQLIAEHGTCLNGGEAIIQLDGWSTENGTVEAKRLGAAVAKALDDAELVLDAPQLLLELTVEQIQYLRDPDGITAHAVITVHALTEPNA